jgi:cytidylate kinase
MGVITVSRQLGSQGCAIASEVAERLGYRLVDREILHRAAREAGVPQIALQEMAFEGRRNVVDRILQTVNAMPPVPSTAEAWRREVEAPTKQPFGGFFSPAVPSFAVTLKDYVDMVAMIVRDLAAQGDVVVAGRGGQALLRGTPNVLHVQILAPVEQRVAVVAAREGIGEDEASSKVRASDAARKDYLRRYHGVHWLDPLLYDLVINTLKIPASLAATAIIDVYRRLPAVAHG